LKTGKKHILIVEDDRASTLYFKELVHSIHIAGIEMTVHYVFTGERAVNFCKTHVVDLVLMDIKLPGMDGLKATRMIKANDPDVVIIAQSAYAMSDDYKRAMDAGCDDYLTKPVSPPTFKKRLEKHLQTNP
jgi:CheY-like chemotaxis protein